MVSCTKNDYKIDVKKIDLDSYLVNRYEVDLMNIPIDDFDEGLISLSEKYEVFLGDLKTDTTGIHLIYEFATDKNVEIIYDECMQVFKDFSQIEKDFEKAFKHIKYYYSDFTPPNIYTYISGFDLDLPVFYNGRDLFIAIDMYLGENENYYALGIPNYIIRRMNRDYIVRDCLEQIAKYYNFSNDAYTRLIDLMIYHGKNWEFIKRSLPDTHDTIITGFTYAQLKWCEKNEEDVWKYLISDNTLFTNDLRVMRKLIDDAPYTSFFTQDSPGSVCKWIGWQIVHSYTKNNSLDLKELMITVDSEAILNKSGYRPK
jgi:hypothetical protein